MTVLFAAFVAAMFACAAFVTQPAKASNLSCYLAINSACGGGGPHGHSLRACFETHSSRLSRPCGRRLPNFITVTHRCDADQRRLCGHAARASAAATCMHRSLADVSESCRTALAKVGVRRARR